MNLTIKEVKEKLNDITHSEDSFIQECQLDTRKGVQVALKQWVAKQEKKQKLLAKYKKMNHFEEQARLNGYQFVAGVDEVGRGPLAGPVVSAAVILNEKDSILGLDDSKKLSAKKRFDLFNEIKEKAYAIGIGIVDADEIDQYNILEATKLSMNQAIANLNKHPDFLLVDAVRLSNNFPKQEITQGDTKSNSIAAASIIAKVTRDQLMIDYNQDYPGYGFSTNMGYGTKAHLNGLQTLGVTPIHRKTFAPVQKYLK